MEKVIKQPKNPLLKICTGEVNNTIILEQGEDEIWIDDQSLPSFHKAIGEFLPQVEVSEEAIGNLFTAFAKKWNYPDTAKDSSDVVKEYINNLRSLLSQSKQEKWISVEERLPENSNSVLVCVNKLPQRYLCRYNSDAKRWLWDDALTYAQDVTHWQPLPPAPTKGGEDGN